MLDKRLSEIIKPLIGMNAVMGVAPHVNTMCVGIHYFLAVNSSQSNASKPAQRVLIADWNRPECIATEDLLGLFMFYSSEDQANQFKSMPNPHGAFGSVAVTQFRQRLVFTRRGTDGERLAELVNGRLDSQFFDQAAGRGLSINVYTDIFVQSEALIRKATAKCKTRPELGTIGLTWPTVRERKASDVPLFVYSAPCVAYMKKRTDVFIPLEVDDALLESEPEYVTHFIWHLPEKYVGRMSEIREIVTTYHKDLFSAAASVAPEEFSSLSLACCDVLATHHPTFPADVFWNPSAFRTCLLDHHAEPMIGVAKAAS